MGLGGGGCSGNGGDGGGTGLGDSGGADGDASEHLDARHSSPGQYGGLWYAVGHTEGFSRWWLGTSKMLLISKRCWPMSHEPRSFVSVCVSSVGSKPDRRLAPGHMGHGVAVSCMGLQPVLAACVSGVLRTELDVGEHAEAAELRGQEAAHARLAEVQPRQPR